MTNAYYQVFTQRNMLILLLLGFASGLPLALTSGTLQAWVTQSGYDIKTIGFMTLVGQAYFFKFLWAPLMDRYAPPFLGRRRGWLVITQFLLAVSLFAMSYLDPNQHLFWLATLAVAVAFFSASQDIVFDAYKTDILSSEERGIGAAISVFGYRIAMLVSGGLALLLAGYFGSWQLVYQLMALLMLLSIAVTLIAPEPAKAQSAPKTLEQAIVIPFKDFFSRNNAWLLLLLIIFYKMGDAFAAALSTSFLMTGPAFSLEEIGVINKTLGLFATIVGALIGGALLVKMSLFRALLVFGLLQALSNFGYYVLAMTSVDFVHSSAQWLSLIGLGSAHITHGQLLLGAVIFFENICGGMGTSAFVALLMSLCNVAFSASQFAFLSALSAMARIYVGPVSGWLVDEHGWADFYLFTVVISAPGLILLLICRETIDYTQRTGEFMPRRYFAPMYSKVKYLLTAGIVLLLLWLLLVSGNGIVGWLRDVPLWESSDYTNGLLQIGFWLCLTSAFFGGLLDYLALRRQRIAS